MSEGTPSRAGGAGSGFRPRQFGKYLLLEKIGSGGMAEIFKAVARGAGDFQKVLVVKRILTAYSKDPDFVKMFLEEARITAPLQHANIVPIQEFDQEEGQYYLAMEFVNGRDLQRVMARANRLGRKVPEEVALHVVAEVCKALWYAFNARDAYGNPLRIIHRDVSPSNILLSYEGEVKVTDFGVARAATSSSKDPGGGTLKGKLGYMSPEQVLGRELDHRSDIFSLGIILFECLTLKRLFLGRTDLQTLINIRDADINKRMTKHPEIAPPVVEILGHAVAREPDKRYSNAREMITQIDEYLVGRGRRTDSDTISQFMRDIFPAESEQEILPLDVDDLTDPTRSGGRLRAQAASVPIAASETGRIDLPSGEAAAKPAPRTTKSRFSPASAMFKVRDAEGNIFGPVSFTNFLSLVKSRSITEEEYCSVNDGEWQRVGEVGQLQPHLKEVSAEHRLRNILSEGAVDRKMMPRLVCDLARDKRFTGQLALKHGSNQKEVYFKDGRPKYIYSNLRAELLGEFLVRVKSEISRAQIEEVVLKGRSQSGKLGDALIAGGVLNAHELAGVLQLQFKARFMDLFKWEAGWYGLFEGTGVPDRGVAMDLDPLQAITEAIRSLYPVDLLRSYLSDHMQRPLARVESARTHVSDLYLSPREMRLVNLLETHHNISDLLRVMPQNAENLALVLRMVFLLIQTGTYAFKGLPRDYRL